MYTTKTNKFIKNYFKIFDKKGYLLISVLAISIFLIGDAIVNMKNLTGYAENILDIHFSYIKSDHIWSEPMLDLYIPFISSIIICGAFFKDYNNNAYEIMTFYNRGRFNKLVFLRWTFYTGIMLIGVVVSATIAYSSFITSPYFYFVLLVRIIPPLLYMNGLVLLLSVLCKNVNVGIAVSFIYFLVDIVSDGRYAKFLTLYGASFYLESVKHFYINRGLLFIMAIIFVIISCKKASKLD